MHSHLSPAAEAQENHCRNNKSKTLDKIRSLSTKVKNQHEECQCLRRRRKRGRERHLKIYIYSESVQDQTAKLICSSFNPCSAPSPRLPSSPSIDFRRWPSPWRLQPGLLSPLLGQNADYYRIGWFDRLGQRCVWKREQSPIHIHGLFSRTKSYRP